MQIFIGVSVLIAYSGQMKTIPVKKFEILDPLQILIGHDDQWPYETRCIHGVEYNALWVLGNSEILAGSYIVLALILPFILS